MMAFHKGKHVASTPASLMAANYMRQADSWVTSKKGEFFWPPYNTTPQPIIKKCIQTALLFLSRKGKEKYRVIGECRIAEQQIIKCDELLDKREL